MRENNEELLRVPSALDSVSGSLNDRAEPDSEWAFVPICDICVICGREVA